MRLGYLKEGERFECVDMPEIAGSIVSSSSSPVRVRLDSGTYDRFAPGTNVRRLAPDAPRRTQTTQETTSRQSNVDALGTRIGTQAAEINSCLTGELIEAEAIAEELEMKEFRVKWHLKCMSEKGKIYRDGDSCRYRLLSSDEKP